MSDGDSSTIGALVGSGVDTKDLFEIQKRVIAELKEEGIVLDYSSHDGLVEGLPFNLDFIKKIIN